MRNSSKIKQPITKLQDTFTPTIINTDTPSPSRQEAWWKSSDFDKIYKKFRRSKVKSTILSKIKMEDLGSYFKLQGYVFGKWANQGDRYNYLAATAICFEDLNRVLKFRNNIGLNHHVGLSFGARGRGVRGKGINPTAHYEPSTGVINLTRYKSRNSYLSKKEVPPSHEYRFLRTGGVGALCHELGHAIDFYGGAYLDLDPKIFSLSGGMNVYVRRKEYKAQNNELRNLLEDVLAAACLNEQEDDFSPYYKRISKNKSLSVNLKKYLLARTELVARLFEQYIAYKLKQMGVVNTLLTHKNYKSKYYPTSKEFERIVKPFDKFLLEFRKRLAGHSSTPLKPRAKKSTQKTTKPKTSKKKKSTKPKGELAPKPKPTTTRKPKKAPKPKVKPAPKPKPAATSPAATTKTITVKIPVTLQTIENHLWGKQLDKPSVLSKMPDKEFLFVWKYVLAGNTMLKKGLNPTDLFNANKHILPQVAHDGIVELVNQEFKKRGWQNKYSLFVEQKEQSNKPKKVAKPTNKTVQYEGFKVVHNVGIQRLQILFPKEPSDAIKAILKDENHRFWWKRANLAWQRKLDAAGIAALEKVLKKIQGVKAKASTPVKKKPVAKPSTTKKTVTPTQTTKATTKTIKEPAKAKLPAAKKHALPPHPVDRAALAEAIKKLEGMEQKIIYAWHNSSFSPEETGRRELRVTIENLREDVEALVQAQRRSNIDQYVKLYLQKNLELIASRATVVSWAITGRGGSYNASKVKKVNERHDKKFKDFWEWRKMRIENAQAKRSTAIRGGTSDAIDQLLEKLDQLQTKQEQMKLVNKILRSKEVKFKSWKEKILILKEKDISVEVAKLIEESHTTKNYHQIPAYKLSNNNAKINTTKSRIATQEKHQERYQEGNKNKEYKGLKVVENAAENRVELFFEDIPSDEVRRMLKERAFKWSRKKGAWQRQLTPNARRDTQEILQDMLLLPRKAVLFASRNHMLSLPADKEITLFTFGLIGSATKQYIMDLGFKKQAREDGFTEDQIKWTQALTHENYQAMYYRLREIKDRQMEENRTLELKKK